MTAISKVLVANRGEIALRIIQTAKRIGFSTVALYSDADSNAPHVLEADEAVCLGNPIVSESYLSIEKVLNAAQMTGANAIHPGYGFLSENPEFSAACDQHNITFIGPPASAIKLMGSKRQSKIAMEKAKVPCIPGYEGGSQDYKTLLREAKEIGFPVMVKASAGGGGRGMRLVHHQANLEEEISTARSEAEKAFGDGELIIEKALLNARHVEIQIFADNKGNVVYLGERDCSVQRRHQKVVEEAPCPVLDETTRKAMGDAAVNAAKACNYRGAGTVEFLLDENKQFFFLEMNTRLQVEHPVTEMVTGTDLVEWQFRVAAGEALPLTQEEIKITGHSIEVRLYAEDAHKNFLPQTGTIHLWKTSEDADIRIDHCVKTGNDITPYYDPMLAKIIAHGSNRTEAIRKLLRGLKETSLLGIKTNKAYLIQILQHEAFQSGEFNTGFIEQYMGSSTDLIPSHEQLLLTGALMFLSAENNQINSPFLGLINNFSQDIALQLSIEEHKVSFHINSIAKQNNSIVLTCWHSDKGKQEIAIISLNDNHCTYVIDNIRRSAYFARYKNDLYIDGKTFVLKAVNNTYKISTTTELAGSGILKAPMDGALLKIFASNGENVNKGQTLAIIEAMKMEHQIKADINGVVTNIEAKEGDQVSAQKVLITLENAG